MKIVGMITKIETFVVEAESDEDFEKAATSLQAAYLAGAGIKVGDQTNVIPIGTVGAALARPEDAKS